MTAKSLSSLSPRADFLVDFRFDPRNESLVFLSVFFSKRLCLNPRVSSSSDFLFPPLSAALSALPGFLSAPSLSRMSFESVFLDLGVLETVVLLLTGSLSSLLPSDWSLRLSRLACHFSCHFCRFRERALPADSAGWSATPTPPSANFCC